jgi:hypothetical protein
MHVDFGDCFEVAQKRSKFPERVPFRLTRMLVQAMEVCGTFCLSRRACRSGGVRRTHRTCGSGGVRRTHRTCGSGGVRRTHRTCGSGGVRRTHRTFFFAVVLLR